MKNLEKIRNEALSVVEYFKAEKGNNQLLKIDVVQQMFDICLNLSKFNTTLNLEDFIRDEIKEFIIDTKRMDLHVVKRAVNIFEKILEQNDEVLA